MSSADRDARIAAIERLRVVATTSGTWNLWEIGDAIVNQIPWLIAELRVALSREEEHAKNAEQWRTWHVGGRANIAVEGRELRVCFGDHEKDAPCDWLGYVLVEPRSVSLSENG